MKHALGCLSALILIGLSPYSAHAEDWKFVNIDDNGAAYFYDAESLKVVQNYAMVWVMWDHSRDRTVKQRTTKDRWIIDCANQTITITYSALYDKNGNVIESGNIPDYLRESNPIVPGSIADRISKSVCD